MNFAPERQAKLPSTLEKRNGIRQMNLGAVGYTVPWAMEVDYDRNCWLHPKHTLNQESRGTAEMRVELREDGYHVWAPSGYTWELRNVLKGMSPEVTLYIPVAVLHQDRDY